MLVSGSWGHGLLGPPRAQVPRARRGIPLHHLIMRGLDLDLG